MNPVEQPQLTTAQRAAESPTLWLSLALGSVLIHLVLFMLASIASNQTAKVPLDLEPIAVEFVDPKAARSEASDGAIAASPGNPSSTLPSSTQVQPRAPEQPPSLNQPIEQPVENPVEQPVKPLQPAKPQPVKRKQVSVQPRSPQPTSLKQPVAPQPQPSGSSTQPQPAPSNTVPQGGVPGAPSGKGAEQPADPQPLATSTTKILEPSQRRDVLVDIVNSYEKGEFHPKIASIKSPLSASILDSPPIAQALQQGGIAMTVTLDIAENGFSKVIDTLPGSGNTLDQATLDSLAKQIFTDLQFAPAEYDPGGLTVKPRRSNLIIKALIRLR